MEDSEQAVVKAGPRRWPQARPFEVRSVSVDIYRATVNPPVRTSFGAMTDRPSVVVKVRCSEGIVGYGEVWCNFPAPAAEYRSRLIVTVLAPLILGKQWTHPRAVFDHLTTATSILAIQAGETGPFSQAIAAIDIALWDLAARRVEQPLWKLLSGRSGTARMPVYASGIGPQQVGEQAQAASQSGFGAFKLKVGFGAEADLGNLAELRRSVGVDATIAVDANQAWSPGKAARMSHRMAPYSPIWLEEPIAADHPDAVWNELAEASPIPVAGGENLYGEAAFEQAIHSRGWAVIQPDVTKWGGISGCWRVAQQTQEAGKTLAPHNLGGGIGLVASAHLLAAVGGEGLLEMDCNPNPLREGLARPFPKVVDGHLQLSETPGLGVSPHPDMLGYRTERDAVSG